MPYTWLANGIPTPVGILFIIALIAYFIWKQFQRRK